MTAKKEGATVGRNTKMTPEAVNKLGEYFSEGLNDREACLLVGITKQTLYNYCDKNPDFLTEKEDLKRNPIIKAKRAINKEIDNEDIATCKWYLERKAKEEFSVRVENLNQDTKELELFDNDRMKEIKRLAGIREDKINN